MISLDSAMGKILPGQTKGIFQGRFCRFAACALALRAARKKTGATPPRPYEAEKES
jgi:hypothetical protein